MKNIILAGVGGQGVILGAQLLSAAALRAKYDVTTAEIHGMAQRGGSVSAQVRYGECVHSSLIEKGTVDVLCAFEPLEALRYRDFLTSNAVAVVATEQRPVSFSAQGCAYPENISERLHAAFPHGLFFDAHALARQTGSVRAANLVLLGALSCFLDFSPDVWREAITATVKPQFLSLNLAAFDAGRATAQGGL